MRNGGKMWSWNVKLDKIRLPVNVNSGLHFPKPFPRNNEIVLSNSLKLHCFLLLSKSIWYVYVYTSKPQVIVGQAPINPWTAPKAIKSVPAVICTGNSPSQLRARRSRYWNAFVFTHGREYIPREFSRESKQEDFHHNEGGGFGSGGD